MSDENNFRDPLPFTTATSMATQSSDNVDIDGGKIRGTRIGEVRQSYGNFSELYINGVPVANSSTSGAIYLPVLAADPVTAPGAGKIWIYALDNGDGTASVRVQGGTSLTADSIIVDIGI